MNPNPMVVMRRFVRGWIACISLWPAAVVLLASAVIINIHPPQAAPPVEAPVVVLLFSSYMFVYLGLLARILMDEARAHLLPAGNRPAIMVALGLAVFGYALPVWLIALGAHLDPIASGLIVMAVGLAGLAIGWKFIAWMQALSALPHGIQGVVSMVAFGGPFAVLAIPAVHAFLLSPLYRHVGDGAWHTLSCLALLLVLALQILVAKRWMRTAGAAELIARSNAAFASHSHATRHDERGPARSRVGSPRSLIAQVRHCASGLMPGSQLGYGALLQVGITIAFGQYHQGGDAAALLPMLSSQMLIFVLLSAVGGVMAAGSMRADAVRPWTRQRWSMVVQGALLWRQLAHLCALWLGALAGLCIVGQIHAIVAAWMLLTVLLIPLMVAIEAWQISLSRQGAVIVLALMCFFVIGPIMSTKLLQVQSMMVGVNWPEVILAVVLADILLAGLVHRRWMNLDVV